MFQLDNILRFLNLKIISKSVWEEYWDIKIYSNIFGRIYSFAKIFVDFSRANLFGYSFVIYLYPQIYLVIHSSNIYDSKYI